MNEFDRIVAIIQGNLTRLQEINQALQKENNSLRSALTRLKKNPNLILPLNEIFNRFRLNIRRSNLKTGTLNAFCNAGFSTLEDFANQNIYDLIPLEGAGPSRCAVMLIVLDHYGIKIDLPNPEKVALKDKRAAIKAIREKIPTYKKFIEFID